MSMIKVQSMIDLMDHAFCQNQFKTQVNKVKFQLKKLLINRIKILNEVV